MFPVRLARLPGPEPSGPNFLGVNELRFLFYMGKNTPEQKDYIMENLVVTVEE